MVNTRILFQKFEYTEPRSLEEAAAFLADHGKWARVLAGGTDLLVQMKMEKVHADYLVDVKRIPELRRLVEKDGLRIGAAVTFKKVGRSEFLQRNYTALAEAAQGISSVQIQQMGTVGGNLCNASPAADFAPPLLVFGAKVRVSSKKGDRFLPLESFFIGPGKNALTPEEFLTGIEVPRVKPNTGSAFLKIGRVRPDMAKVSVAVLIEKDGDFCSSCKIALGAVAEKPIMALKAEEVMGGERYTEDLVERASQRASEEIRPIDDIRSTAWYRKEVSRVIVRNAIDLAWRRAIL